MLRSKSFGEGGGGVGGTSGGGVVGGSEDQGSKHVRRRSHQSPHTFAVSAFVAATLLSHAAQPPR